MAAHLAVGPLGTVPGGLGRPRRVVQGPGAGTPGRGTGPRRSGVRDAVRTFARRSSLVVGMFALMAEYEADVIRERTMAGLAAARTRGRNGGRKPKMTPELIDKAQRMYDSGSSP
ncbi:recombinase family protein [Micromonospora zamorensis]|uniref:recombinase family protein n=1 Tax=Micromonospora zamorensis TaxID=709883 RepID=UPI0015617971